MAKSAVLPQVAETDPQTIEGGCGGACKHKARVVVPSQGRPTTYIDKKVVRSLVKRLTTAKKALLRVLTKSLSNYTVFDTALSQVKKQDVILGLHLIMLKDSADKMCEVSDSLSGHHEYLNLASEGVRLIEISHLVDPILVHHWRYVDNDGKLAILDNPRSLEVFKRLMPGVKIERRASGIYELTV